MRKCLLVFLLYPFLVNAQLKEFEVSEMERPDVAVVQANTEFPDDALLLVYSSLKDLNFRSSLGGIDKVSYNPQLNRYEILFKPDKQMLFVYASNFVEQKIETFNPSPKAVFYSKVEEKRLNSGLVEPTEVDLPVKAKQNVDDPMLCKDLEGNVYETVQIGDKIWMAENLRTSFYSNGNPIRHEPQKRRWKQMTTGAYCWYDNDRSNDLTHGKLYNWYAVVDRVNDNRLCPSGWRVPSDMDWDDLARDLDPRAGKNFKRKIASRNTGSILKSKNGEWSEKNVDMSNDVGFNALPSGKRHQGNFKAQGSDSNWWSSGELERTVAWYRLIQNGSKSLARENYYKDTGFSVRCVKDANYRGK